MSNNRKYNWKHSSYIGTARLCEAHLKRVANAPSVTREDKTLAVSIQNMLATLARRITRQRVNQNGTISQIGDPVV